MGRYKAVIFDLDGVITDTAEFHFMAWKKLADEIGVHFDRNINEQLKGVGRMDSLEIILSRSDKIYTDTEKQRLASRKNEYYKKFIAGMSPRDMLPGALDTFIDLKRLEIETALASASKNAFTVIDKLGLQDYFSYIVDARSVVHGKPDPEIFQKAASGVGVPCAECIGIEDAKSGIAAIKSAGMFSVGIGSRKILSEADDVIPGLNRFDIRKYL